MYEPRYYLGKFVGIRRLSDSSDIPNDANNKDWQDFLSWYAQQDPVPFTLDDQPYTPPTTRELAVAAFQDATADAAVRDRAIVLALIDQLNQIGTQHNALLTWLGTQTTLVNRAQLAGFQLPNNIQPAQAKQAILDKIDSGDAD